MKILKVLAVLVFAILFIASAIVFRARPQYLGQVSTLALQDTTEVYFDDYGIPHIYAASGEDAYKTLGYLHAQERLFQMELLRRAGGGRLAEIFGEELLPVDRLFRSLGTHRKAEYEAGRMNPQDEVVKLSQAYLDGVNTYIDEGRTPIEFTIGRIPKTHFTLADMHLISAAMSFNFAQGLRTDPLLTHIQDVLGPEYLSSLEISLPADGERVPVYPNRLEQMDSRPPDRPTIETPALQTYFDMALPTFYGSNTWAIAPSQTEDGNTLLANDTHIGYAQPCTWYEAHLEYPGHRIYGNYMAGIPFALTGHNAKAAWGVTMLLNDDMDLYCETVDLDRGVYTFKGSDRKLEQFTDTIQVKGKEEVVMQSHATHHGPLVSEFVRQVDSTQQVSMRWTYLETDSDLLTAFYELGEATDMSAARDAVSLISAPGLNISYADADGNIALWAAARLFDRPATALPYMMLNGATGQDEPGPFLRFESNPSLENPPWGYIYSSNNQHDGYEGQALQHGYYEPDQRASRLVLKLGARSDWSMEAMKRLILDDKSSYHEQLCEDMIEILRGTQPRFDEVEREAIEQLKDWDGRHDISEIAPSIYYRWLYNIFKLAMADELGEETFEEYLQTNIVKSSMSKLICHTDSPWWDNVMTDKVETGGDIVSKAFSNTIEKMVLDRGGDITDWEWGQTHQAVHRHAFDEIPLIGSYMGVGPIPAPGGIETINNSVFYLSDDRTIYAQYGPQMRRLIDLNRIERSVSILPTGQSGSITSKHFKDQAQRYVDGKFRPQLMNESAIHHSEDLLLFYPRGE